MGSVEGMALSLGGSTPFTRVTRRIAWDCGKKGLPKEEAAVPDIMNDSLRRVETLCTEEGLKVNPSKNELNFLR